MKKNISNIDGYLSSSSPFGQLSLHDLLDARDKYHVDLMNHPNVIGTAVGRYRIRKADSWPAKNGHGKSHGTGVRTLENSEVRPYSWPAILVFVENWATQSDLSGTSDGLVPKTLYLSDGRAVPVCVIEAPKELKNEVEAINVQYPLNNIGGGNPVIAEVQGRQYAATIACLVGDGHKVYALTNRHVTGEAGEVVYSRLGGKLERIGVSANKQLTREEFTILYPGLPGKGVYVNLDAGLIEIDNLDSWTAGIGTQGETMGPMVDLSISNSMSLIGCHVKGCGAASGDMEGEVHALFYRYKALGGFEYVADLLIGPRSSGLGAGKNIHKLFSTHPGDSGTLWLLEPNRSTPETSEALPSMPLAMQWGRNMLYSAESATPQSYALATFLAKICTELAVDPIRDWNLDQADTWGAIGHYSIATRTSVALSGRFPKLSALLKNNALIVSHDDKTIINSDFKGMGQSDFVALADVPDFYWKQRIGKQGHTRPMEGPNHFADMDQPGPDGKTLLELCEDPTFIDADKWNSFYDSVVDLLSGEAITPQHRGLLPFRAWQIFDEMVDFATKGKAAEFVCAGGVLMHYIGDSCQPLHISYLHDGDPMRKYQYTFKKGKKEGQTEMRPLGNGVHSAYEDEMVNAYREDILDGLKTIPRVSNDEQIGNGYEAAQRTIELMRATFKKIAPADIVDAFIAYNGKPKDRAEYMWEKFGKNTIAVMKGGTHLLAVLWESAWALGDGENNVTSTQAITETEAMEICADRNFLPSLSVDQIGAVLKKPKP
ncbi:MAG TPA: hypothetical protein VGO67_16415 [Verrucomicrobiae bacterium]|jgi:hypothetical protein